MMLTVSIHEVFRMALSKHGDTVHSLSSILRVEQLAQDLRYSLRMVRRNPLFATIVTLTLALGIGMTTAMFSVVNGVLIKPLPYPQADRLVWIAPAAPTYENEVSRADYVLWKNQAHSFEAFMAYGNQERSLVYQQKATTVQLAFITGDFWNISGANPVIGRLFGEHERDEIVLSWALFQIRFGGDPRVIERTVTIDGRAFTVVGVLPRSFQFLFPPERSAGDPIPDIEAYIPIPDSHEAPGDPIRETTETGPVPTWVQVVGKLRPDASFTRARAEMQVIYDRVRQIPNVFSRWPDEKMRFIPLAERVVKAPRLALTLLLGAVGFVLLIAGANFANLLMARASTRQREIAVRSALGASRGHLIRQFLVESISLAMLGGSVGLLIAEWAIRVAKQIGAHAVPKLADVRIDTRVLLFTLAVSFATGIIFGMVPVLGLRRRSTNESLKSEGGTSSVGAGQLRLRRSLVTIEFALAIVLLTGAGLLLKSFWRMNDFPPGFEPAKLLVLDVNLGGPKYFRHWPKQDAYIQELLARVQNLPDVKAFGIHCGQLSQSLEMVGDVPHEHGKDAFAVRYASTGFFAAVGAPLIEGRWPTDEEWRDLKNLVIVNQTFARLYGGKTNMVGKHIRGGVVDAIVIGVVADFKDFQLDATPEAQVYVAYPQAPGMLTMRLFLRTDSPKLLETTLPRLASGIDLDVPVRVQTLEETLSQSIAERRFNMYIFEVFAGAALLLALIGIYGVLSYLVKQRTREIGIRMALGAQRKAIMQMVVGQGMRIAFSGMAWGVIAAMALTRLIASMLYETRSNDPMTFAFVALILAFMTILACWQPAFRAANTDPVVALRDQ
jgi:putative ABC transport system permease protein